MTDLKNFLEDEIFADFDKLQDLEPGSEERSRFTGDMCKKIDAYLDVKKLEFDLDDRTIKRDKEENSRIEESIERKKDKWIDRGINLAIEGGKLGAYAVLFCLGLKFEESGIWRGKMTNLLMNLINKKM